MLNTYFKEVHRRRKRKLFFWILVFLFATFLFFFFQGKYIRFGFFDIQNFGTGGTTLNSGSTFQVQSFGIIKIKTHPEDANIFINDEKHYNEEKIWKNYGKYTIKVQKDGYLEGNMEANLDQERDFYIDDVFLLPNVRYTKIPTLSGSQISDINEANWIAQTSSGTLLFENNSLTGTLIKGENIHPIGGGKFLSGSHIVEYSPIESKWITQKISSFPFFLKKCEGIQFRNSLFFCQNHNNALTENGKTLTGVLDIHKNALIKKDSLLLGEIQSGNTASLTLSGGTNFKNFFLMNDEWHTTKSGSIYNIHEGELQKLDIQTNLDSIGATQILDDLIFFIGKKDNKNRITVWDIRRKKVIRTLNFPTEIKDIRIYRQKNNLFIKTSNSLLFLYKQGNKSHWIVDGEILIIKPNFCIYKKDGVIWKADWSHKKMLK